MKNRTRSTIEVLPQHSGDAAFYRIWLMLLAVCVIAPGFYMMIQDIGSLLREDAAKDEANQPSSLFEGDYPFDGQAFAFHETPVHITKPTPAPISAMRSLHKLEGLLAGTSETTRQAANALIRFATTGKMSELRGTSRDEVKDLARQLAGEMTAEEIADYLEDAFRIPRQFTLNRQDTAAAIMDVFDAVSDNPDKSPLQSSLIITDACAPDGRVTGAAHVIPAGAQQVYAVFENARGLEGLSHVFAIWRNPNDDRMVFSEMETIRSGSAYNYVWLHLDDGWAQGNYRVDLYHPERQSQLLASETFNIR